jgi:hypothetical protein
MDSSISIEQQRKSRRTFIFVCLAFIVPIVLAKLALDQQWFNYGVTNQGQLLDQELNLDDLGLSALHEQIEDTQKPWLLVYNMPTVCNEHCLKTFNGLSNTYVALGKGMKRVNLVALQYSELSQEQLTHIDPKRWTILDATNKVTIPDTLPPVFVVDPLGNLVVSHQPPETIEELPAFGKSIVADFKILLKLSRIG